MIMVTHHKMRKAVVKYDYIPLNNKLVCSITYQQIYPPFFYTVLHTIIISYVCFINSCLPIEETKQ